MDSRVLKLMAMDATEVPAIASPAARIGGGGPRAF